jgi:acetylornithine deacetylase/succinyl-diaminopimelate desuccinylase-like protein
MPTCNICGLLSGYTGEGIKNILPSKAIAKLDFHLVPDMDPDEQFKRLSNHLTGNKLGGKRKADNTENRNSSTIRLDTKLIDQLELPSIILL